MNPDVTLRRMQSGLDETLHPLVATLLRNGPGTDIGRFGNVRQCVTCGYMTLAIGLHEFAWATGTPGRATRAESNAIALLRTQMHRCVTHGSPEWTGPARVPRNFAATLGRTRVSPVRSEEPKLQDGARVGLADPPRCESTLPHNNSPLLRTGGQWSG